MKRLIVAFITVFLANIAFAQKARLTDASIVKDTAGTVYPASAWKSFLSSGKYGIRAENPASSSSAFIIYALSEEEIRHRQDNLPRPFESGFFITGRKPASFVAKDLEGNKYKLKDLIGKVVILNFWFVNCGPCRTEIPELNKLVEEYKDSSNVVFLAVALDEEKEVKRFVEKIPFNYQMITNGRYITAEYGITVYPTHAVIDKEGKVLFHTSGLSRSTIPWLRKMIGQAVER
ncbi:TlpA family protein disulfide reductase [Terrimonas sp. NA20]|uniref:TlpA family protein disulfide reductase n=1 Tax=Terrimonas ginsenosidimutans TaxID=2908004 RepID=A0ABS9KWC5_9BACT|nr:TlpA disulfide reductase family protein [Terrimonas ginsenosidimutans]MCG2616662.1 TlpA family protein disulfide reductase [Terrimonas ginsenosidimutans]